MGDAIPHRPGLTDEHRTHPAGLAATRARDRRVHSARILVDQFDACPAEIRRLLNSQLESGRNRDLADRMRAARLAF